MLRSRKRLIEVIDSLNDLVVPIEQNLALRKCANFLEDLYDPPTVKLLTQWKKLVDKPDTTWYIKGLLLNCFWHIEHAPWAGPNSEFWWEANAPGVKNAP